MVIYETASMLNCVRSYVYFC